MDGRDINSTRVRPQKGKLSTSELGSAISGLQAQKDELPAIRLAAHSSLYKLSKHEAVTSPV